jgi:hypothetical protein
MLPAKLGMSVIILAREARTVSDKGIDNRARYLSTPKAR